MKKHNNRLRTAITRGVAMLSLFTLMSSPITAMANYDKEDAAKPEYEESKASSVVDETTEAKPFSIEGNGQLLDDSKNDDTKEFLTVQTKNNQTFFVVIDRASNTNNVYMLSTIDENDLSEFLDEGNEEEKSGLALPEMKEKTEEEIQAEEQEKMALEEARAEKKRKNGIIKTVLYMVGFFAVLVLFLGGYYYFKFYRPRKDEENAGSENLEQSEDDFWETPTVRDEADDYIENDMENDMGDGDDSDSTARIPGNDTENVTKEGYPDTADAATYNTETEYMEDED